MSVRDVRNDVEAEISALLGAGFSIEVSPTAAIPHANEAGITFPNLNEGYQRCKLIETAVLYIDIRRSTELNLEHKAETVAKLYSAFVRAMTRCADEHNGRVRGIIGDRVMVLFNPATAFKDAVDTAVAMNSVAKYVLNKHFKANEISCGIGIDYGRMLATKTGVRRRGTEQANYRNLVWLGRPANVASKLTDLANKSTTTTRDVVNVGRARSITETWEWQRVPMRNFIESADYSWRSMVPKDPFFASAFITQEFQTDSTPPILMTEPVYRGIVKNDPERLSVKNGWFEKITHLDVPGYKGDVYGGDVHFAVFE